MEREHQEQVLLQTEQLCKSFGGVQAVYDVTFSVYSGQIKGVIGPNGAGKTTLFNLFTGVYPADKGKVYFCGRSLEGLAPYKVAEYGIARTFQNVELFEHMSVLENVMVGLHPRTRVGFLGAAFRLPSARREEKHIRQQALEILEFIKLAEKADLASGSLPFGLQRKLEIARALAVGPKLLLLDEPASGLNAAETADLGRLLLRIRQRGITILLVEHDMSLTMDICDEIMVMDYGRKLAEGSPREIQQHPEVIAAYLGEEPVA
ncbi:MAG: ABC transporter ATP-binding protein [Deltaproteobacteria bacterium]|nr:ABC transporter ATP-binding protein [Deltaproteobacteria bacterium]MBW2070677.1 ABC transporter ATP-binding protein [Deltaproteobacteria bacterium]